MDIRLITAGGVDSEPMAGKKQYKFKDNYDFSIEKRIWKGNVNSKGSKFSKVLKLSCYLTSKTLLTFISA